MLKGLALAAVAAAGAGAAGFADGRTTGDIPTYQASTLSVYTATTVRPTTAKTVTANRPGSLPVRPVSGKTAPLSALFGTFGTVVPGGQFEGYDYVWWGTSAKGHAVRISAGCTWDWHGRHGRWVKTGDAGYPIALVNALDGHTWRVGVAGPSLHADIVLWDGFTYFVGRTRWAK